MMFDDITCNVITRGDIVIASGYKRGNLHVLDGTADRQPDEALVAAQPSSDLWHQRLAHVNDKMLDKLVSCDVSGVDLKTVELRSFCEGKGNQAQAEALRRNSFDSKIGEGALGCVWPDADCLQFRKEINGHICK